MRGLCYHYCIASCIVPASPLTACQPMVMEVACNLPPLLHLLHDDVVPFTSLTRRFVLFAAFPRNSCVKPVCQLGRIRHVSVVMFILSGQARCECN